MRDLPTGTVTFLFTDTEGSTRLLHELGDAYAARVLDHENEAFATGRVKGRRMTLSDAVDYALADID